MDQILASASDFGFCGFLATPLDISRATMAGRVVAIMSEAKRRKLRKAHVAKMPGRNLWRNLAMKDLAKMAGCLAIEL